MGRTWLGFAVVLLVVGNEAIAIEEPDYDVVEVHEEYELRRYSPYLVAETEVEGDFDDVGNEAFGILFDYISGENRNREEISMTAPVAQQPAGQKIAMTAPVIQTAGEEARSYHVRFVMPSSYTLDTLPVPTDPRIVIREFPARLVAVRRYTGFWSENNYRAQEERLLESIEAAGLEPAGPPIYARYNSPFSLWFLRRNEVQIPVQGPPASRAGSQARIG